MPEIGTSNGYSTLWLADAVEQTGGHVISVEMDPARTALAHANLERAGLEGQAELRTADAADDGLLSSLVPIGAGLLLVVRGATAPGRHSRP